MDAATIEETNKLRASMGLPLLPVPGAAAKHDESRESRDDASGSDEDEEEASTIETRQAKAYENYRAIQDAEAAKKKRDARIAAAKRERDNAQRFAVLEGKGLGEAEEGGDVDAKAWLKASKKRQKLIEQNRKLEEERAAADAAAAAALQYTSKDLAGIKVAHEMTDVLDGDDHILTLKDATIAENEEEGDELENINVRAQEALKERLELKKKKPAYDVHDMDESGERGILSQYDEEIYGKKAKKFTLDGSGAITELSDILGDEAPKPKRLQAVTLDDITQDAPVSDYMDISEIKVKKPKKKKSKTSRQKPVDEDDIFPVSEATIQDEQMDVDSGAAAAPNKRKAADDDVFVDDEDLQASLAIQRRNALKKRKKTRPEDIAKQLKEQAEQDDAEAQNGGGVVIDEISEFVSGLRKPEDEVKKTIKSRPNAEQSVTAMDDESDDDGDHEMRDGPYDGPPDIKKEESPGFDNMGIDEEKTIGMGMGSALALLRERGLIKDAHGAELNEQFRNKAEFLSQLRRIEEEQDDKARQQRERDRLSGRWDRMSNREREEWARQQNATRDQQQSRNIDALFKDKYRPNVELKYTDEHGRSLSQKEAFKHLSHQFHGKTSGKGKTDKLLKKIEAEKKRESQSILDSSQNAAASQKRREAGVRLQ